MCVAGGQGTPCPYKMRILGNMQQPHRVATDNKLKIILSPHDGATVLWLAHYTWVPCFALHHLPKPTSALWAFGGHR